MENIVPHGKKLIALSLSLPLFLFLRHMDIGINSTSQQYERRSTKNRQYCQYSKTQVLRTFLFTGSKLESSLSVPLCIRNSSKPLFHTVQIRLIRCTFNTRGSESDARIFNAFIGVRFHWCRAKIRMIKSSYNLQRRGCFSVVYLDVTFRVENRLKCRGVPWRKIKGTRVRVLRNMGPPSNHVALPALLPFLSLTASPIPSSPFRFCPLLC